MPLTKAEARKLMLSVKGTSEGPYFGRPSIFYGESFVGRVHDKEEAVALRVGTIEMRDVMLEAEPKLFYITDHYRNFPFILARLSALTPKILKEMVAGRAAQLADSKDTVRPRKKPLKKVGGKRKIAPKKAKKIGR